MISLSALLSRYSPVLVLDAASTVVHAGWLQVDAPARWTSTPTEAGVGVFAALRELGISPNAAAAFLFCEGPGSILGIRTVATILRTWNALQPRPIYAYRSLELIARQHPAPGTTVICDARRQSWHTVTVDEQAQPGSVQRLATADLPADSILITPGDFRRWSALPVQTVTEVPYDPATLSRELSQVALLRPTEEPDAFLHEDPSYVQWTPQVHQAPEVRS